MSCEGLFVRRNNALMSKRLDIAKKRSARFRVSSALGALGRRFESCRPDSKKPSHRKSFPDSLFYCKEVGMMRLSEL